MVGLVSLVGYMVTKLLFGGVMVVTFRVIDLIVLVGMVLLVLE